MNLVVLIGNLTRDPEMRTTQSGISKCTFTIAVQRDAKDSSGQRQADFIQITTWRAQADNCQKYLAKGRRVAVTGHLQTGSYEDNEGKRRFTMDVVARNVEFQPSGGAAPASGPVADGNEYSGYPDESSGFVQVDENDLPF